MPSVRVLYLADLQILHEHVHQLTNVVRFQHLRASLDQPCYLLTGQAHLLHMVRGANTTT